MFSYLLFISCLIAPLLSLEWTLQSNASFENVQRATGNALSARASTDTLLRPVYVRLLFSPYSGSDSRSPIMYLRGPDGTGSQLILEYDTQVVFGGTSRDGPLSAGIFRGQAEGSTPFVSVLRAIDYNVRNSERSFLPSNHLISQPGGWDGHLLKTVEIGSTISTNAELMDPSSGKGLVADAYFNAAERAAGGIPIYVDPSWRILGPGFNPSTLNLFHRWGSATFAQSLASRLNLNLPRTLRSIFEATNEEAIGLMQDLRQVRTPLATSVESVQFVEFPESDGSYNCLEYATDEVSNPNTPSQGSPREERFLDFGNPEDVLSPCSSPRLRERSDMSLTPRNPLRSRACVSSADDDAKVKALTSTDMVLTRYKGAVSVLLSISEAVAKAANVLAILSAPVFIILDIINGEWQAAAFATAGIVAGALAIEAIAGPIGFVVGGLLAALFAIIPSVFKAFKHNPPSNNIAKILQYSFFGDQDHTGNEKCNEKRKEANWEQNCTAVYGPNTLAKVFKWEVFDAVAFLVHHNQGFPMAIPDIAAAFTVVDWSASNSSKGTSLIDCDKHYQQIVTGGRYPSSRNGPLLSPSAGYQCGSPKYSIDRGSITIPVVNRTAAEIYKRVIPAPGGDCKILTQSASGIHLPLYNVSLTGLPAAIACNITTDFGLNGSFPGLLNSTQLSMNSSWNSSAYGAANISAGSNWLPTNMSMSGTNSTTASTSSNSSRLVSDGLASDGSSDRAFEPAPAPSPFQSLTSDVAACMSGTKGSICLPNGTYTPQTGSLGFDIRGANHITLPPNGSINIQMNYLQGQNHQRIINVTVTNQTANGQSIFQTNAALLGSHGGSFNIFIPDPPQPAPCLCLFKRTMFHGDVACFGVGGGNLSAPFADIAQSVKVHGDAIVWVYATAYNDTGGVRVDGDISDLESLSYGTNDNFKSKIKALWISPPRS